MLLAPAFADAPVGLVANYGRLRRCGCGDELAGDDAVVAAVLVAADRVLREGRHESSRDAYEQYVAVFGERLTADTTTAKVRTAAGAFLSDRPVEEKLAELAIVASCEPARRLEAGLLADLPADHPAAVRAELLNALEAGGGAARAADLAAALPDAGPAADRLHWRALAAVGTRDWAAAAAAWERLAAEFPDDPRAPIAGELAAAAPDGGAAADRAAGLLAGAAKTLLKEPPRVIAVAVRGTSSGDDGDWTLAADAALDLPAKTGFFSFGVTRPGGMSLAGGADVGTDRVRVRLADGPVLTAPTPAGGGPGVPVGFGVTYDDGTRKLVVGGGYGKQARGGGLWPGTADALLRAFAPDRLREKFAAGEWTGVVPAVRDLPGGGAELTLLVAAPRTPDLVACDVRFAPDGLPTRFEYRCGPDRLTVDMNDGPADPAARPDWAGAPERPHDTADDLWRAVTFKMLGRGMELLADFQRGAD